eukprot:CAMPEP_0177686490 /NCGR_PEP_ID=MMETSP0447-20121125/33595_1 /TAXON_ID=0 /ORGANISM="Stygamoeba regulata, Strain BSH-02190019" /LENGTH=977 /DNA_ID=CAMNT_0019196613 /DNA_START=140 /DNA_END=3069 /DNA_ORIENTATION=+
MSKRVVRKKQSFKGLTNFIKELRACESKEDEQEAVNKEMANIRKKFTKHSNKKHTLPSYQKRKYICKIMYMFMLGYDVEAVNFVYMEAVKLCASDSFVDKQVGYIALGVLLTDSHSLIPLVIQRMQTDLNSRNSFVQGLPLTAIANIGSREMAETLTPIIVKMLLAPDSASIIRKKSALSLLQLYRKFPYLSTPDQWLTKLELLLKEHDVGLLCSVLSLILFFTQSDDRDAYAIFVDPIIQILKRIVLEKGYSRDYLYFKVPCPWLQVKLYRFLRSYPMPTSPASREALIQVLKHVITHTNTRGQSVNQRNAKNCVLFEALSLVCHLESDEVHSRGEGAAIMKQAAHVLGKFMSSKEANVRYLTLEGMYNLVTSAPNSVPLVARHLDTVIMAIRDPDISIRRRALDLLFGMCDLENSKRVVAELMGFLQESAYDVENNSFHDELVIKIAILAERYISDGAWYIESILRLITLAGDTISDALWHRVVRVVTNNEDQQAHGARVSFRALQHPNWNEVTVKIGGYLLGEFGHLIADDVATGPEQQFYALHSKFPFCSAPTQALLLSTYIKFSNLYPEELADVVGEVFLQYQNSHDTEIQQRASEYWNLSEYEDAELISKVLYQMPKFPERKRLDAQSTGRSEDTTEGGDYYEDDDDEEESSEFSERYRSPAPAAAASPSPAPSPAAQAPAPVAMATPVTGMMMPTQPMMPMQPDLTPALQPMDTPSLVRDPADSQYFRDLSLASEGVLYEDRYLQVGVKSQFQKAAGRYMLYYGNVSGQTLSGFSVSFSPVPYLAAQVGQVKPALQPDEQTQQLINLLCETAYNDTPTLKVSFTLNGTPVQLSFRLPVVPTKFCQPDPITPALFFHKWKQIVAPRQVYVAMFQGLASKPVDLAHITNVLTNGYNLSMVPGVDANPNNLVAAGLFHTERNQAQLTCLVRLETHSAANFYRISLRTDHYHLTAALASLIISQLGQISTIQVA